MPRALFVTNQLKTEFYDAVARRMAQLGAEMFWISVSERWTQFLLSKGWPRAKILSLPDFGPEWSQPYTPTEEDKARIARIEATGEASFKNVLIMDRELNKRPGLETEAYVYVVTREIEKFVRANDIRFGFGEPTWAPEMIASLVLEANGGRYYMHHSIRVPSERIGFFRGIFQYLDETQGEVLEHQLFSQLLFSLKVNPRTVVFLGYSDTRKDLEEEPLVPAHRAFFVKLGYAWTL